MQAIELGVLGEEIQFFLLVLHSDGCGNIYELGVWTHLSLVEELGVINVTKRIPLLALVTG